MGSVTIPDGVDVSVKARVVTVKGARGTLNRSFRHLAVDIFMPDKQTITVEKHFGKRKELAAVRTVCSIIQNAITGVMRGYKYKMRAVYAHFPLTALFLKTDRLLRLETSLEKNTSVK